MPLRRVGPSVPDITPRPRWFCRFATRRFFTDLLWRRSPLALLCEPGVHYTQLDTRVAPRYVRQTALLSLPRQTLLIALHDFYSSTTWQGLRNASPTFALPFFIFQSSSADFCTVYFLLLTLSLDTSAVSVYSPSHPPNLPLPLFSFPGQTLCIYLYLFTAV